jgi:hypothetical protein
MISPTLAALALARVSHSTPHSHGSGLGDLLTTFVHSVVASLGWQAGRSIASLLGPWLIVLAVIAVGWWLLRNRRTRRRTTRRRARRR